MRTLIALVVVAVALTVFGYASLGVAARAIWPTRSRVARSNTTPPGTPREASPYAIGSRGCRSSAISVGDRARKRRSIGRRIPMRSCRQRPSGCAVGETTSNCSSRANAAIARQGRSKERARR